MLPGVASHADAIAAARAGAQTVKLHLSAGSDGLGELRTYSKLFRSLQFIPSGALEPEEVAAFLREPCVLAVGTSRITPYGAGGAQVRRLATEFAAG
jgi:2-dehydro-3-deoxyphosphogluconate aldolase/(4S)-4-hydroxy-2-oxoglutarate aldolase